MSTKKPNAYQAVIIENFEDGSFRIRMEAGRVSDDGAGYIPEIRKSPREEPVAAKQAIVDFTSAMERLKGALTAASESTA